MRKPDVSKVLCKHYPKAAKLCGCEVIAAHLIMAQSGSPVYKIATDFGQTLKDVDMNISTKLFSIWQPGVCYLQFPFSFPVSDNLYVHGGYVVILHNVATTNRNEGEEGTTVVRKVTEPPELKNAMLFLAPLYDKNDRPTGQFESVSLSYEPNPEVHETAEELLARMKNNSSVEFSEPLWKFIVKSLVYVHSGDPDLRHLKQRKPHKSRDAAYYKKHPDESPVPTVLVGYNYKKPVVYDVDQTIVTGHWRWQPCGQGRSNVKLIWIDEHMRHYKNVRGMNEQEVTTATL